MALFVGGPADGWRVEVAPNKKIVDIAINPHAPAFTPDNAVLSASTQPTFRYKLELISSGVQEYAIYTPEDWNCDQLLSAFVLGYKQESDINNRLDYINSAKGTMYDNDDRDPNGRPYKI